MIPDPVLALATQLLALPWLQATLITVVGLLVVRIGAGLAQRRVTASMSPHWGLVVRTVILYAGAAAVLIAAAHQLGLDLTALVATAGVASVAIGFASQTSLSNLIAGLFLLVDRPFQLGDTVEIETRLGVVKEISLLSTYVRTFDGVLIRWPNEVVLKSTILNYTRFPARRVDVQILVAQHTDLVEARRLLHQAVTSMPTVLLAPETEVVTRRVVQNAVELEVRAWVPQVQFLRGRDEVIEAAMRALFEAGVPLATPQITVWPGSTPAAHQESR